MSRTNHKNKEPNDFYPTPRKFIELLAKYEDLKCDRFLEPAAGDGRIAEYIKSPTKAMFEIREESIKGLEVWGSRAGHHLFHKDFLAFDYKKKLLRPDLIVTNPPFSLAFEFVNKCLEIVAPKYGQVIMLLRVGFFHSWKRYQFNRYRPPARIYRLAERPKFREEAALLKKGHIDKEDRGSDASDYVWAVWESSYGRQWTRSRAISLQDLKKPKQTKLGEEK